MGQLRIQVAHGTPAEKILQDAGIQVKYGDTRCTWDSNVPSEVDAARALFDKLTAERYLAFNVKGESKKGTQMKEFDPYAERVMFFREIAGG